MCDYRNFQQTHLIKRFKGLSKLPVMRQSLTEASLTTKEQITKVYYMGRGYWLPRTSWPMRTLPG